VEENQPRTRVSCRIRICTERTGRYCFNCCQFPCDRLKHLDKRYREKYGMSEIENLVFIHENGINEFVINERMRWQSPEGILCVHDRERYP